jgi:membrane-associated HD superfamily phosphohydrolase
MSLLEIFHLLEYLPLLIEMRSSPWVFPMIATFHLFGLVIIGGAVIVGDLQLLNHKITLQLGSLITHDMERLMILGLVIMVITGVPLFMCFATKYYYLTPFWVKLLSLILVVIFTFTIRRNALKKYRENPTIIKIVAITSISLWTSVALSGRLIGFP